MDDSETVHTGMVAEELALVYPQAVKTGRRTIKEKEPILDENGMVIGFTDKVTEDYLYVDYKTLVPILLKSIQELNARVEMLEELSK